MIVNTQSTMGSFTYKLLAIAFCNRIKGRDQWDLAWLNQTSQINAPVQLVAKIGEHNKTKEEFLSQFNARVMEINADHEVHKSFWEEMLCFLPSQLFEPSASQPEFWTMIENLLSDQELIYQTNLASIQSRSVWEM